MVVSKSLSITSRGVFRAVGATLGGAAILVLAFYLLAPIPDPLFPDDYSTVVTDRRGETLRVYLSSDEQWILPPDPDSPIPERLRRTVITFEDRYFYRHPGVNPGAVMRAAYQNLTSGRRISGASTITMQLARLLEAKPRTIAGKILETVQALAIEMHYTKEEILRLYLDHAPYGGNIRGYRAASQRYFGKEPFDLTWAEAATLAVLPNAPRLAPGSADLAVLEARRNELLDRIHRAGLLGTESLALAKTEPVPTAARPFDVLAPHAADLARDRAGGSTVATTLDAELQRRLESTVSFHARYLASEGIENVSALVVDTGSGEAVAYAGSQDYFDYSVRGHIDGVQAQRSTGSILKPFLYALAMDDGLLVADSLLKDVPTQIGAYAPQNIDRQFRGLVSAEEALARSLNVPAVRLLGEYGLEAFYYFLADAGLNHLFRRPEDYGLPLILGGAEASAWELASLYRGLATGGLFSPVRLLADERTPGRTTSADRGAQASTSRTTTESSLAGVRLLSNGAAFLTLEMLQEVRRPGADAYWRAFEGGVPVAWKTGTSYGLRDAWAVGVSPQWTVVVWAGNFTGEGSPNLSSSASAGYLLFEIFNTFPRDGAGWFSPAPGSIRETTVCLTTGYRATEHCPETAVAWSPAGAPPLTPCPYHETIYVTLDGSHRVDSRCWKPGSYRSRSALVLTPDVAGHIRAAGLEASVVPPWAPGCRPEGSAAGIAITYPSDGARIFLPRDLDGALQKLTVRAAHRDPLTVLYWYVDTRYVGSTAGDHKMSLDLGRGRYTLTAVDGSGGRASVTVVVDVESERTEREAQR